MNLHPEVGEDDLKELFSPFGTVNYVHVVKDAVGVSTGEAYVQVGGSRARTGREQQQLQQPARMHACRCQGAVCLSHGAGRASVSVV